MTKELFIEKLQVSAMSADVKERIMTVIESGEFEAVKDEIKAIIQEDIEKNLSEFDGLLNADDIHKIEAAEEEMMSELAEAEEELVGDMAFVEAEMADLEASAAEVNKTLDKMDIDAARNEIMAQS